MSDVRDNFERTDRKAAGQMSLKTDWNRFEDVKELFSSPTNVEKLLPNLKITQDPINAIDTFKNKFAGNGDNTTDAKYKAESSKTNRREFGSTLMGRW